MTPCLAHVPFTACLPHAQFTHPPTHRMRTQRPTYTIPPSHIMLITYTSTFPPPLNTHHLWLVPELAPPAPHPTPTPTLLRCPACLMAP